MLPLLVKRFRGCISGCGEGGAGAVSPGLCGAGEDRHRVPRAGRWCSPPAGVKVRWWYSSSRVRLARLKAKKKKKCLVYKTVRIFTGNCDCQILRRVDKAQRSWSVPSVGGREAAAAWDPGGGRRRGGSPGARSAEGRGCLRLPAKRWPGGNNRVTPQRRCGRKALPRAEVQRFTEQSKRELPSPLGTNSPVRTLI